MNNLEGIFPHASTIFLAIFLSSSVVAFENKLRNASLQSLETSDVSHGPPLLRMSKIDVPRVSASTEFCVCDDRMALRLGLLLLLIASVALLSSDEVMVPK